MGHEFHVAEKSPSRSPGGTSSHVPTVMRQAALTNQGLLQPKADPCACGGSCPRCQEQLPLQKKLAISEPGDVYEQEADRVADEVLAAPAYSAANPASSRIQRFAGQATGQAEAASPNVDQVLASPGRPLEPMLRHDMEQCFGHDFSRVRVHSDAVAEQSARDVNAQAYTVGHDVVFGAGRFAPRTNEGRRLIAHELAHVVQQSGADETRLDQGGNNRGLSPIYRSSENRGLSPIHFVAQQGAAKPTRSVPPDRGPLLSVAPRVQRLGAENATTGVTPSASAIPLFCGPYEDWIRYFLGIEQGVISDFTTCFCLGAGVADALPVIGLNPWVEGADCMCNLLTTLQLAFSLASHGGCLDPSKVTELDAKRVGAYLGATVLDCGTTFAMLISALVSGLVGGAGGTVSGGPPGAVGGGLGGVGAGAVAGDMLFDALAMVAQNLALQGTFLPHSQWQACQRTWDRFNARLSPEFG